MCLQGTMYMDGRTGWFLYTPPNFVCGGYNNCTWRYSLYTSILYISLQWILSLLFFFHIVQHCINKLMIMCRSLMWLCHACMRSNLIYTAFPSWVPIFCGSARLFFGCYMSLVLFVFVLCIVPNVVCVSRLAFWISHLVFSNVYLLKDVTSGQPDRETCALKCHYL